MATKKRAKKRTTAERRRAALLSWKRRKAASKAAGKATGNGSRATPSRAHSYSLAMLNEREATHGDYGVNAGLSQALKNAFRGTPEFEKLNPEQKESSELIATKFGRIFAGDPNEPEHWRDIAGYATLIAERLEAAAAAKK